MMLAAGQACHVYPSGSGQVFAEYDRCTPMKLDKVEFDETGCWDAVNYRWVAPCDCTIRVHHPILWSSPTVGDFSCAVIAKNMPLGYPAPSGVNPYEVAGGQDIQFTATEGQNQGTGVTRILQMNAGDWVQGCPCINGGGTLAGAVNAGGNTCNYFEIEVLSVR
jgi:hypothetical protein